MQEIKNVVTWLKNWFYDKTEVYAKSETYTKEEVNSALGNKVNVAQGSGNSDKNVVTSSSGNITTEPKVSAGSGLSLSNANQMSHSNSVTAQTSAVFKKITYDGQGHITGTANVDDSDLPSHSHSIANVTNLQTELNSLDSRLDNLESIKAIEVVSTKPTASSNTMNKLYIVAETISGVQKVNVYYTKQTGSTYEWVKLDDNILDELSIDWSEIENNPFDNNTPSDFATSNHEHGNLSNAGTLTTHINNVNKVVVTDSTNNLGTVDIDELNCGTFAELQSLIGTEGGGIDGKTVILDRDYKNSGNEPPINVPYLITIIGNGHIVDADEKCRVFELNDGVRLENIVIKGGSAIQNQGKPATNGYGGGVYIKSGSTICTIHDCTFINNYANGRGGAIYCAEPVEIADCKFVYSDYNHSYSPRGFWINNDSSSEFDIYNCTELSFGWGTTFYRVTNKHYVTNPLTSVYLAPKGSDNTADEWNGVIRLYYGDEPS